MVSSKNGPSRGSGLSKRASTWRSPFASRPSRATSRPGMKPSTRTCRAASPSAAASGIRRILSSRRTAPTNWASSSARITPRLAESMRGLTTHGNAVRRASTTGSSSKERRAYGGTGTPSPRSSVRIRYLSRAAAVDLTALCGSPSAFDRTAASTVVASSTPTTASIGRVATNSTTWRAAWSGCSKSSDRKRPGCACWKTWARSEATTTSTPSFRAAPRKAAVRYVVVGRSRSSRGMLLLRSSGVRVLPGGVVGHVEDLDDLGKLLPDHRLDALLQRDVDHAAPLTATAHLQVDHLVLDVDERHHPAVTGDGGVDRRVEQVLDFRSDPGVLSLLPITPRAHIGHGVAASLLLKRF